MSNEGQPDWKRYEDVARDILTALRGHLGMERVEPKQKLPGASGAVWEIDAKGVRLGSGAVVVVECRSGVSKRLSQEDLAGVAFRISDLGADGGVTVSPLELQAGAKLVATAQNITHVRLPVDATPENFVVSFLDKVLVVRTEVVQIRESLSVVKIDQDGNRHRIQ